MAIWRSCMLWLFSIVLLLAQISCEKKEPVKTVLQNWQNPASVCNPPMSSQGNCSTSGPNVNACVAGRSCNLSVAMSGGAVSVTLNGAASPVDPICVPQGTAVQWTTSTTNSTFSLTSEVSA